MHTEKTGNYSNAGEISNTTANGGREKEEAERKHPQPPSGRPAPAHPVSFCISTKTFHHHQHQLKMNPISKTDCMLCLYRFEQHISCGILKKTFEKHIFYFPGFSALERSSVYFLDRLAGTRIMTQEIATIMKPEKLNLKARCLFTYLFILSKYFLTCESSV